MTMTVLALGHYLQGEAWPDRVERLVVEHDFAMFRTIIRFVSLHNVWLFGCPDTLIRFIRWVQNVPASYASVAKVTNQLIWQGKAWPD